MTLAPLTPEAMAEWSAWLRDDNAIHLSREAAEASGFGPRRVNPGPANLALLISAVLRADPGAEFASITADFTGNAFEGDELDTALSADSASLTRAGEVLVSAQFSRKLQDER
jgi:acyl dehydratase